MFSGQLQVSPWTELWASYVETISLKSLDTSDVTNMKYMFNYCPRLTSLDLGDNFNTSKVTDMSCMFNFCSNLTSLNLSKFDTSNVTNMRTMFQSCENLVTLDLGDDFDTSKVTDMSYMFSGCSKLNSLDVSQFNTSNVTDMHAMFQSCSSLNSFAFGEEWDTSKVTDMGWMFARCSPWSNLDVSDWDTSSVTDMSNMFYVSNLTSLDLSDWDTSKVKKMYEMFSGCQNLYNLDVSGWDTSSVTDMSFMFSSCSNLSSLTFGDKWNISKVVTMESMFAYCSNLTSLDLSKWDTSNVGNMYSLFQGCRSLTSLDLSNFDTSNVQTMYSMFSGCSNLESLTFGDKWNTSKVTDMYQMFYNCYNLKTLNFGKNFSISNVTDMSDIFSGCSNLETIDGIGLGSNNIISSFSGLFSGLTNLKNVTFNVPKGGATFTKLATMQNMFSDCSSLEKADLGNWILPNLTNTSSMFSGCSSLTNIDLSWSGIKATQNNYSITDMFKGVPSSASLEIGSDNSQMLLAIRDAFSSITTSGQALSQTNELTTAPNAAPALPEQTPSVSEPTPEETPDVADPTPEETPSVSEPTPEETPNVSEPTPEGTPSVSEPIPEETQNDEPQTPANDTSEAVSQPQDGNQSASVEETTQPAEEFEVVPLSATAPALARAVPTAEGNESVYVHPDMVSAGDKITYKVTVKYVGDVGVKSGRITLNFPIPEDIQQFQGDKDDPDHTNADWYVSTTEIKDSGSPTGYKGGRVVEEPKVVEVGGSGSGQYALQGVFEGLYTGTEVTVSLMTTVQKKEDQDYNTEGYAFWDGTAYVTDSAGTSASQTVRLWNQKNAGGDGGTPPTTTAYQLSYVFTGDVPSDAALPATTAVDSGTSIKAAAKPNTTLQGYTFDGWYRSDTNQKVTPDSSFNMPSSNLTLTGKWTLDDAHTQKITVKYEYTTNNDAKHIPDGAPALPGEQTVKIGQTHYIQRIDEDADHHIFGGWTPTLSVDGINVPLTKQSDGTYQDDSSTYSIDIANGTLSTDQFKDKSNVVVTFSGPWTPYTGTIHFDANGGEDTMNDMTNVTWDTTKTLTANGFTYPDSNYTFVGWAKTPSGAVVKGDQARADGLIDQNGKTVTLYAVWKRGSYGVGYNLNHVTSSNTDTTVALGGSYSTTLTADSGYKMNDVSITMGGVSITNTAYNASTGEVSINNVSGNIIIKAEAITNSGSGEDTGKHPVNVDSTGKGTATSDKTEAAAAETVTITTNGTVDKITVTDKNGNDITITDKGNGNYTFEMPDSEVTVKVEFDKGTGGGSGGSGGGGGGGGSSVTDKYPVHVEDTGNGTATSDKQEAAPGEVVTVDTNGTVTDITIVDKDGNEVPITDNGDGSFTFEMPNSEVTVKVEFEPLPEVADPNDTGVADWLDTVNHNSYLNGYPDGTFQPGGNMTRAEVAQMFYNLLLNKDVAITVSFSDVNSERWYATAVNTLASLGIITGVGNEKFAPERAITRAEFTAIAMRFAKLDKTGINIFSDVQESDWFYDYVIGSIQYGWITGYSDSTFRPNNTITRAEVTTITNRMLGRAADETYVGNNSSSLRSFADVTGTHWAYYQIVEATNSHEFEKANGAETWKNLK
ncbi:BspA family leucine-rich repeat surface protein [Agathobaculum sp. LCP25S3_E8]|uniref:BspA family leucine-rich repeat surface protein n=1 Tax=Agathobaculum sp. LCP25S3_E8 TaxID=3438735 RepID=UPI003F9217FC